MCRSLVYLTFLIAFILIGVFTVLNNKTFINYIKKINNETYILMDCCKSGRYNNETQSCIGKNNENYPFALPCNELVSLDEVNLEEERIKPEDIIKY